MTAVRLSVTEVALAGRCMRQLVLSREGWRVLRGGGGIGTAAHEILNGFVRTALTHEPLRAALVADGSDDARLRSSVSSALQHELYERAPALAPHVRATEIVRLATIVHELGLLASALLRRARSAGLRGDEAFRQTFLASERAVEWTSDDGRLAVGGVLDLLCRDHAIGATYVWDLKTALTDATAEQQVQLYALLLRQSGEGAAPVLVHATGEGLTLKRVSAPAPDAAEVLAQRLESIRTFVTGEAVPPSAPDPQHCRSCPVQGPCWERWGRTLADGGREPTAKAAVARDDDELAATARRLQTTLAAHRVGVLTVDPAQALVGPSVVRYLVRLKPGEKLDRVRRAAKDVQRELGWPMPPFIDNAGEFVSIDAPRAQRVAVPFPHGRLHALDELEIPVGLALDGSMVTLDLAKAPHLLVAGTTGSGKTVFLKSLLLSLLSRPEETRPEIVIIDPKAVDFHPFDALPLRRPVVTSADDAIELLTELANEELEARTKRLVTSGVDNRLALPADGPRMPALVVVIDEFADLMLALKGKRARLDAFLGAVQRLLQKSRFAGIHLVLATQRPSVDVLPGLLKANLPVAIAFQLPKEVDSRTVLDQGGAEHLLGRGDLLLKREGRLTRAQGLQVTPADFDEVARGLARRGPN